MRRTVVAIGIVALLLVLGLIVWSQRDRLGATFARGPAAAIEANTYQAVFLVGGQVYFGKATARGDDYLLLDDVFYLSELEQSPGEAGRGQLVKRGTELHGPSEPMIIPIGQVLFIENLRQDAEVMNAIRRYHAGDPGATTPPAPTPTFAPPTPPPAATATLSPIATPSPTATR